MYIFISELELEIPDKLINQLEESADEAIDELAEEVEFEWRRTVASHLHSSRDAYFKGMSVERVGDEVQMRLDGDLAVAVETGSQKFDLKPGFLKGRTSANIPLFGNRPPNIDRFRRAPAKTANWIHPGVEPHNLIDKVQVKLEEGLVEEVFTRVLGRIKI